MHYGERRNSGDVMVVIGEEEEVEVYMLAFPGRLSRVVCSSVELILPPRGGTPWFWATMEF